MSRFRIPKNAHRILLLLIIAAGVFARAYQFGNLPGGLYQDEAFAGYEAYSLLTTGRDSYGYAFPVYLIAWGSGMNALNSYLMIPFIALFGLHTWVIRLPQLIVGCLSIPAAYALMKRLADRNAALFSALLVAVAPWHVMLSRWGLESNLLPGFLLFGLTFFAMGLENPRYLALSAVMYGLSLYSYGIIWPVLPLILAAQLAFCVLTGRMKLDRRLILPGAILLCMAAPLLLFVCVNYLGMPEIRLPFLSVPRLTLTRTSAFEGFSLWGKLKTLLNILRLRDGGSIQYSIPDYGLLYPCTLPLLLLGLVWILARCVRAARRRRPLPLAAMLLLQPGFGLLLGLLYPGNVVRLNCLFLPMLLIAGYGACALCRRLHPRLLLVPVALYLILFGAFEHSYFTEYADADGMAEQFSYGLDAAVDFACALDEDAPIYMTLNLDWPRVLVLRQMDPEHYRQTAALRDEPLWNFSLIDRFDRFHFDERLEVLDAHGIYILRPDYGRGPDDFAEAGWNLEQFGIYTVAWIDGN